MTNVELKPTRGLAEWLVLYQAYNAVFKVSEMSLLSQEISLPQLHMLALLEQEGRALSTGEIARRMVKAAQSITGLVDRLVARKMVVTKGDPKDRRKTLVEITDAGRAKLQEAWPIASRAGEELFNALSDADLTDLKKVCEKLRGAATQRLGMSLD